ncbi:YHS domain-containing protein [Tessaracoccus sp. Y36]
MMDTNPKAVDLVCGMSVQVGSEAASMEYEGNHYYFCSQQCAVTFKSDPTKYVTA